MNAKTLMLSLLLVPFAAPASPATIEIDCARPALPSQQAVARLLQIDNFGQAYSARSRLMIDVQRACQRSAARIQVVLQPAAAVNADARRLVGAREPRR